MPVDVDMDCFHSMLVTAVLQVNALEAAGAAPATIAGVADLAMTGGCDSAAASPSAGPIIGSDR